MEIFVANATTGILYDHIATDARAATAATCSND